jgi:hypothetical protein
MSCMHKRVALIQETRRRPFCKNLRVGLAHTIVYGPYVDYIVLQTTELQPTRIQIRTRI